MPAIDTDDLSAQFVSQYRDNVFCNKQKVFTYDIIVCPAITNDLSRWC